MHIGAKLLALNLALKSSSSKIPCPRCAVARVHGDQHRLRGSGGGAEPRAPPSRHERDLHPRRFTGMSTRALEAAASHAAGVRSEIEHPERLLEPAGADSRFLLERVVIMWGSVQICCVRISQQANACRTHRGYPVPDMPCGSLLQAPMGENCGDLTCMSDPYNKGTILE